MRKLFTVENSQPMQSITEAHGVALEAGYNLAVCYITYSNTIALESNTLEHQRANAVLEKETQNWLKAVGGYVDRARTELTGCLRDIDALPSSIPSQIDLPMHSLFWFGDDADDLKHPTGLLDSISSALVFFNEHTGHQSSCFLEGYRSHVAAIKTQRFNSVAYHVMTDWLELDRQYSPFAADAGFQVVDAVIKNRTTYATPYYPTATRIQVSMPSRTTLNEATVLDYLKQILIEASVSDKPLLSRLGTIRLSDYSCKSHLDAVQHTLNLLEACTHWQQFLPKSLVFDAPEEGQEALLISNRILYEYFQVYLKLMFNICNAVCAVSKNIVEIVA